MLKGKPCLKKADWHHLGRAESGPPLAGKPNSIKTQGPGTTWVIALHKRLSRCTSGRWMEFGLPMGEVLKETPSRFENHNPFGKGMIAGKATGRWTSASDFQSYCPLKNVGSLRGKRSYTFSVKKPAAHGFFTLSVHGLMFAYTTHPQYAHTWTSMSQSNDVLAGKYVCQARFYTSCSFHSGPFRVSHLF